MCSDPYMYSQPLTVGGGTGYYAVDIPFSGDEYEYAVYSIACGGGGTSGSQAIVSTDMPPRQTLPYDGSVSYGGIASAPSTPIIAIPFSLGINQTIFPETQYLRVPSGGKRLWVAINAVGNCSVYVTVLFRFLPVRVIPGRATTVPDVAEQQYNEARADKVVERLQMDVEKGDKGGVPYGRLN